MNQSPNEKRLSGVSQRIAALNLTDSQQKSVKDDVPSLKSMMSIKTKSGGQHSFSQREVTAFANHLNICLSDDPKLAYLMPINADTMDLTTKVQDGVLLAAFINLIEPDTIDFRAVNYKPNGGLNEFHVIENQNLNITAAKTIGMFPFSVCAKIEKFIIFHLHFVTFRDPSDQRIGRGPPRCGQEPHVGTGIDVADGEAAVIGKHQLDVLS